MSIKFSFVASNCAGQKFQSSDARHFRLDKIFATKHEAKEVPLSWNSCRREVQRSVADPAGDDPDLDRVGDDPDLDLDVKRNFIRIRPSEISRT